MMWLLSKKETKNILDNGEYGVLATCSKDLKPYGVPLVYVVVDDFLYIHTGEGGEINQNLDENNQVSFTIVGKESPIYDGKTTLQYKSVIVKGIAEKVEDNNLKYQIMQKVVNKYLASHKDGFAAAVDAAFDNLVMHRIKLDDVSGHQNK